MIDGSYSFICLLLSSKKITRVGACDDECWCEWQMGRKGLEFEYSDTKGLCPFTLCLWRVGEPVSPPVSFVSDSERLAFDRGGGHRRSTMAITSDCTNVSPSSEKSLDDSFAPNKENACFVVLADNRFAMSTFGEYARGSSERTQGFSQIIYPRIERPTSGGRRIVDALLSSISTNRLRLEI